MARAKPAPRRRRASARPRPAGAPRRGRPPRADRERLLDAAERAIRRSGPRVSLERIAATAGVTKPVLFAHVGDRCALVHALAERLLARIEAALAAGREGRAALEGVIAAPLVAGVADARRRAGQDPSAAAPWGIAIIGALHMVGLRWLDGPESERDAAALARQLTDLLWSGLAPSA